MQKQHTVLCIQDLSCVGRCSLAVVLPALAAMGVQPCALPTALLSTHTGGLGRPARTDESGFISAALAHYAQLGLAFDWYTAAILPAPHRWRWWNRPSARLRRR
ncbi:MAG: hypothetical protein ACLRZH_14860 [Ruthenibacterium lactatiformans]